MEVCMRHQRILIIGCSGSGKSYFSRELHKVTQLPLVHLDQLYWKKGWEKRGKALFLKDLQSHLQQSSWIIDGNFDSTLPLRMQYADLVICLDVPRIQSLQGVTTRWFKHFGRTRVDMAVGCPEKVDMEFLQFVWTYQEKIRPHILQQLRESSVDTIIFKSRKSVKAWLKNLT